MRGRLSILLVAGAALVVAGIPRAAHADPHAFFYTAIGQRQLFFNVLAALDQADYVEPKEDIFETGEDTLDARKELLDERQKEIEKTFEEDSFPLDVDGGPDGEPIDPGELDLISEKTETDLSAILARAITLEGEDLFTSYLLYNIMREQSRRDDLAEALHVLCRRGLGAGKAGCDGRERPDPIQDGREKQLALTVKPMKEIVESKYFALIGAALSNALPNNQLPFFDIVTGELARYAGDDNVRRLILSLGTKWDDGNPENKYRIGGPYGYAIGLGARYLNAAEANFLTADGSSVRPNTALAAEENILQRYHLYNTTEVANAITGNEVGNPDLFTDGIQFRQRQNESLEASCSHTFRPSNVQEARTYIEKCTRVLFALSTWKFQDVMELGKEGERLADNFGRISPDNKFPEKVDFKLGQSANADDGGGAAGGPKKPGGIYAEVENNIDKGPTEIPKVYSPGDPKSPNYQESSGESTEDTPSGSGSDPDFGGTPFVQGATSGQVLSAFNPSPGLGVTPLREIEPFKAIYETTVDPSDYDQSEYDSGYGGEVAGAHDGSVAGAIDYAISAALPRLQ